MGKKRAKTRLEKTKAGEWTNPQPKKKKPARSPAKNIGQGSRGGVGAKAKKYKPIGKPGKKKTYGKLKGARKGKKGKR